MTFDLPPDNPGYPCGCGGSIEPSGIHYTRPSLDSPGEPCCEIWTCDQCGYTRYEHEAVQFR